MSAASEGILPALRSWVALGAAGLAAAAGAYVSSRTGDWINFARAGAVIVIVSALLTAWEWLRAGTSLLPLLRHVVSRERISSEAVGLFLIVAGTLIWAFGDPGGELAR